MAISGNPASQFRAIGGAPPRVTAPRAPTSFRQPGGGGMVYTYGAVPPTRPRANTFPGATSVMRSGAAGRPDGMTIYQPPTNPYRPGDARPVEPPSSGTRYGPGQRVPGYTPPGTAQSGRYGQDPNQYGPAPTVSNNPWKTLGEVLGPQDWTPGMLYEPWGPGNPKPRYGNPDPRGREMGYHVPAEDTKLRMPIITRDMGPGDPAYDEWVRLAGGRPQWSRPASASSRFGAPHSRRDVDAFNDNDWRDLSGDQPDLVDMESEEEAYRAMQLLRAQNRWDEAEVVSNYGLAEARRRGIRWDSQDPSSNAHRMRVQQQEAWLRAQREAEQLAQQGRWGGFLSERKSRSR